MYKIITIKKNELAVVYHREEFKKILTAGKHLVWPYGNKVDIISLAATRVATELARYLLTFCPEVVHRYTNKIITGRHEIVLYYQENQLKEIVLPESEVLFWKTPWDCRFETIPLSTEGRLPDEVAEMLYYEHSAGSKILHREKIALARIKKEEAGIVFIDHVLTHVLPADSFAAYVMHKASVAISIVDKHGHKIEKSLALALQEYVPWVMGKYIHQVNVAQNEVGFRYEDNQLVEILAPGSQHLFWMNFKHQAFATQNLADCYEISESVMQQLLQPHLRKSAVIGSDAALIAEIPTYYQGVLKIDGKIINLLNSGIYGFWHFNRDIHVEIIDRRMQTIDVSGQEILTKDKVGLRINLVANWQYTDILKALEVMASPKEFLYRELQFGLREAVGTRTLDELLENKELIDQIVSAHIEEKVAHYGIKAISLGVKDIILPGSMQTILAQVVEAEKSAQANVIRRREETAATRSLLNTAKVMENSPIALRLKEMETLERIAEKIDRFEVVGGLDQVLHGLINIRGAERQNQMHE